MKTLIAALMLAGSSYCYADSQYTALNQLHTAAIASHTYIADIEQYGVKDKWVASLVGDCEDFALYMQMLLRQKGQHGELWIVRTETNELHAVLKVAGKYVLDNRFDQVVKKDALNYKWLAPVKSRNDENSNLITAANKS